MSDIILHHSQPLLPSTAPSLPFAPALHLLMLSDLQAHAQGPFLYRSFLPRPTHPLQLLWRF